MDLFFSSWDVLQWNYLGDGGQEIYPAGQQVVVEALDLILLLKKLTKFPTSTTKLLVLFFAFIIVERKCRWLVLGMKRPPFCKSYY